MRFKKHLELVLKWNSETLVIQNAIEEQGFRILGMYVAFVEKRTKDV